MSWKSFNFKFQKESHFLNKCFYSEIFERLCCGKCCDVFFTTEIIVISITTERVKYQKKDMVSIMLAKHQHFRCQFDSIVIISMLT